MALTQISTAGVKDDAVTSGKIPTNAVGSSELADNAVDTNAIAADAVTAAKLADDAVVTATIQDNAVNSAKIADDAVVTAAIADNAVVTASINADAVTSAKIADNAVVTAAINADAVTTAKIADDAVGTAQMVNNAVTVNQIADNAVTQAKINVPLSNRNLVINGNFRIAQRGSSSGSSGYQTVDRWTMSASGASAALTQSRYDAISGTSPYAEGHHQAFRILNAGQNANTQGYCMMQHHIEAQNIIASGWNYKSSSSYITLSFWVRGSVTQTYLFNLITNDGTMREWNHLVSLTGDQWTKVTMTIPGDSNITMNNDNGIGLTLYFNAYLGSHYTSGSTVDQWVTHAGYTSRPDMGSGWWTTSNSTFMLTGVQLEAGSVATNYEHRSFGQELALCQRYFHTLGLNQGGVGHGNTYYWFMPIATSGANYRRCRIFFPVTMRTAPTVTNSSGNNSGSSGTPSGVQHGDVHHITFHWDVSSSSGLAELVAADFSAEL